MAESVKPKRKSVLLRLTPELFDRVEAVRGDVSRQRWLHRAVEMAAGGEPSSSSPASPRASFEPIEGDGGPAASVGTSAREATEPKSEAPKERPNRKSIVPPQEDGECPYTAAQLSGRSGLPVSTCKRKIEDGSWRGLL